MKSSIKLLSALALAGVMSSCTIVRQGEVGVKRSLGKIQPVTLAEGPKLFNPFVSTIIKVPTRTMNIEVRSPLPSKEGLTVQSDISILYRVESSYAPKIVEQLGRNYDQVVILPIFRSAVTDISSKYFAKDMHTGQHRAQVEGHVRCAEVFTNHGSKRER